MRATSTTFEKRPATKLPKRQAAPTGSAEYRCFALDVAHADASAATAVLATATGALPATTRGKRTRIAVWVPVDRATAARRHLNAMLASAQRAGLMGATRVEESTTRSSAWEDAWKQFFKPFAAGRRLYIVPTWEQTFRLPRGSRSLRLDPGMAFGTGQHPTTRLALRLLLARVRRGHVVMDIGCGSGILGLAAALRGASVYSSDADPIAVRTTRANFAANRLTPTKIVGARGVPATFPRADVVVANITARVIESLARQLAAAVKPHGVLVTSGFVSSGKERVLQALQRAGLEPLTVARSDEWIAAVHARRSRP